MTVPQLRGLYVITDQKLIPQNALREKVEQAILGCARLVQYRVKREDSRRKQREVSELLSVCHTHGVPLIINDDVDLVLDTGADGIHIGKDDTTLPQARERLGDKAIIGVSCYNDLELALRAQEQGANYIAFGSFFASPSKPNALRADTALIIEAKKHLTIPICAIGGVTAHNSKPLIDAGADILAVITDVFTAEDTRVAAQRFAKYFN